MSDEKILVRVYNPDKNTEKATLTVGKNKFPLELSAFEIKTFLIDKDKMEECDMIQF